MSEEKDKKDKEAIGMVIPPQSSVKLISHGKDENTYYTWEIKVYCDNLDLAFDDIKRMDKKMKEAYIK